MLIYRMIFPNGKMYIGLTTRTIRERKNEHKSDFLSKRNNWPVYNAMNKYGWENIKWEILEDNITDFEYLKEREAFNILKYDTYLPNGYNMTLGGEGRYGRIVSEETRKKMSLSQKSKPLTKKQLKNLRNLWKICRGRKQSKEEIEHRRKTLRKYTYDLIDKQGNNYNNIEDLRSFCIDKEINYLSLYSRIHLGKKTYKGWVINKNEKNKVNREVI